MVLTGVFELRVSQTKGKVRLRQPLRGARAYAKATLDLALELAVPIGTADVAHRQNGLPASRCTPSGAAVLVNCSGEVRNRALQRRIQQVFPELHAQTVAEC